MMSRPRVYILTLIVFALVPVLWATGAVAKDGRGYGGGRPGLRHFPPKDCTRINGRYGYYGNPWCNKFEQGRWDRWNARQRLKSQKY